MKREELKEILENHLKWLRNENGGSRANLHGADLSRANLTCADLTRADLTRANLTRANLTRADLTDADLHGANIELKLLNKFYPIACPDHGSFIAWKKAMDKIVKLEVLTDAKRSSAYSRKCRCSAAKVIAIEELDGIDSGLNEIASTYDNNFIYRVGEIVTVDNFDEDRRNECAPGIHFFITRQEAVEW